MPVSPRSRQAFVVQNNLLPDRDNLNYISTERLPSEIPYQRYGHTVVNYKEKAYLWGGRSDTFGTSSVLHEFDPGKNRII